MIMSVVLCEFCGIFGLKSGTKGKPAPMFWSRLGWGETEGHPVFDRGGCLSYCPFVHALSPFARCEKSFSIFSSWTCQDSSRVSDFPHRICSCLNGNTASSHSTRNTKRCQMHSCARPSQELLSPAQRRVLTSSDSGWIWKGKTGGNSFV
jgi:hypothetical protein